MDSEQAQAAMAAAYDKARQETVELNRVKNDFVAKLEMAGRQATISLKTMGEMEDEMEDTTMSQAWDAAGESESQAAEMEQPTRGAVARERVEFVATCTVEAR